MDESRPPRLTYKVHLPGGQARLREAALYVMRECAAADFFGRVKLNKVLWRADFQAFAHRHVPVTGRQYQRLARGPAPVEMLPILQELEREGHLRYEKRMQGPFEEQRPIALVDPALRYFSSDDLTYLDDAVRYYWNATGRDASNDSHGVAWDTRDDGDPMPYELAFLSDEGLSEATVTRLVKLGRERDWQSL